MSVKVDRRGATAIVTLHRPDKRNAIDAAMTAAIDAALNELEDDVGCAAIIITGGSSMFCAGTDIVATAGAPTERGGEYGIIRRRHRKPFIAAVEGFAFGGGMEIALACDLVVSSRTARFGLPEVQRGFVPTCGGMFRPLRALPINVAKQLILTGEPLEAERAFGLGLVNVLTEPGEALEASIKLAARIAANGPLAVRECLSTIEQLYVSDETQGWSLTDGACQVIWRSEDAVEGQKSFAEKRPPLWVGR